MPGLEIYPTVTCLCCTRNRRQWLPKAIRCFQWQDYPAKRLLILADGEDVSDLVPTDDPRITLCIVDNDTRPRTMGEKRNLGCSLIDAEVIAIQDDDDWYAPGRLTDQVERLVGSGKAVSAYHTCCFTDNSIWWRYPGGVNIALGASLCFLRSWWLSHPFEHLQIGQDEGFGYRAAAENQLANVNGEQFLVATVHSGNTSERKTEQGPWMRLATNPDVSGYAWGAA